MPRFYKAIFLGLVSIMAGIIAAGMILGFLKIYVSWLTVLLTVLITAGVGILLFTDRNGYLNVAGTQTYLESPWSKISNLGYIAGWGIFITITFLPLALWPLSPINPDLTWDAGLYHFPKAAELLSTGSYWDLSIAYGEYPPGYEMLIAFSLIFSRLGYLIGVVHGLIALLFLLSLFGILCKYSRLPRNILFFVSAFLIASFDFLPNIEGNPFQFLTQNAYVIGKNDFFLAASMLALLVFAPFGTSKNAKLFSLRGIGITSMIVACTKPNGIFLVAMVMLLALIFSASNARKINLPWSNFFRTWTLPAFSLLIGLLWIVRNLISQGMLFSQETLQIQSNSILFSFSNPNFIEHIEFNLKILIGIFTLSILLGFWGKILHWSTPLVFGILIFSFIAAPASAVIHQDNAQVLIAWRFGIAAIAYISVILLTIFDIPFTWIIKNLPLSVQFLLGITMIAIFSWGFYNHVDRYQLDSSRSIVLRDQYREAVGNNGYFSAYDYVQKNITNSVVWVENGLPFYVYGPELTNSTSRANAPDFQVFFRTAWINEGGYPELLSTSEWNQKWFLEYEDTQGRIYRSNE